MLQLPKTARTLVARVSSEAFAAAAGMHEWQLATTGDDRRYWERLYLGDHVILLQWHAKGFELLAAVIAGKTLKLTVPKSQRPLRLGLQLRGSAVAASLPLHPYQARDDLFCLPGDFIDLWERCAPVETEPLAHQTDYFFATEGHRVRVASTLEDLSYVETFAKEHAFGYRRAFLTLIAEDAASQRVGALLAQPSHANRFPHASALQIFGHDYAALRLSSLSIKRIYVAEKVDRKFEVHEALLRALIELAPFMVEGDLKLIESVSYSVHPMAERLGFRAEIPESPYSSIYYWKPFALSPKYIKRRTTPIPDTRIAAHGFIAARSRVRFFAVLARRQDLSAASSAKAWALADRIENRGLWSSLAEGNIVFFLSNRHQIEGYGIVSRTRNDRSLRPYPLRIDFSRVDLPYVSIDITDEPFAGTIRVPDKGGIFPIGQLEGSQLESLVSHRYSEGRMFVVPNPHLLPGTNFQTISRQIFVVQSWSLIKSVLPTLRDIVEGAGYSVTHADDVQGQVIFGDIWRLLNEAEIVLVDFTDQRPNVYLEFGMALVLGKPIVAITKDLKDIPSDTTNLKVIVYEDSMNGINELKVRLLAALRDRSSNQA